MRAARVELASSWSASRTRAASRARVRAGLGATLATLGHRRAASRGGRPLVERIPDPEPAGGFGVARARRVGGSASTRVASSVRAWCVTDSARRSTRRGRDDATAAVPTRMRSAGVTPVPRGAVTLRTRATSLLGAVQRARSVSWPVHSSSATSSKVAERHQLDGVVSPVAQLAVADLGQGGGQHHVHDAGAPGVGRGAGRAGPALRPRRDRTGWCVRRRPSGAAAGPG